MEKNCFVRVLFISAAREVRRRGIEFSESGVLGEEEIEVFVTMALRKAEEGEAVELIGCEGAEDVHGITGGLAYVVEIQHGCGTAPRVVGGRG